MSATASPIIRQTAAMPPVIRRGLIGLAGIVATWTLGSIIALQAQASANAEAHKTEDARWTETREMLREIRDDIRDLRRGIRP